MLDLTDLQLWDGEEGDRHGGAGCETWFTHQAEIVKQFAEQLNVTEAWIREDYQEMNELLIKYFHGTVSVVFTSVQWSILAFDLYYQAFFLSSSEFWLCATILFYRIVFVFVIIVV